MKKKLIIISCIILVAIISIGTIISMQKYDEEEKIESIIENKIDKSGLVSLEEARTKMNQVIENGKKGLYRNLIFQEFVPVITEEDSVNEITLSKNEVEDKLTIEELESQLETLQKFYEFPLDKNYVVSGSYEGASNYYDIVKEIEDGTTEKRDFYLLFIKDEYYAHVDTKQAVLWVDKGFEGVAPGSEDLLEKTYYAFSMDGSLDDEYMTETGTVSIRDAIEGAERYFNEEFPVEQSGEITYKVQKVWIINRGDNVYGFDFAMRRSFGGLPFEYASSGTSAYGLQEDVDMMEAVMEKKGEIILFNGMFINTNIKIDKTYTEILSPDKAISYLSEKIGEESIYNVTGIELGYTSVYQTQDQLVSKATPVWIVYAENQNTDKEVRFYIDIITGDIKTRVM